MKATEIMAQELERIFNQAALQCRVLYHKDYRGYREHLKFGKEVQADIDKMLAEMNERGGRDVQQGLLKPLSPFS